MRRYLIFLTFVSAMLLIPALVKFLTDGFRMAKMCVDFPPHPEWEYPLDAELFALLDQPFRYLGKGSQCYVFESCDQKIVIKFFRFNDPRNGLKIFTLFNAAHIAYECFKEETGLLYIHLNRTNLDLPTIHCKDAIGRSYRIHLDEWRFAVQKKVTPFETALKQALSNPDLMQQRLNQFLDLLFSRTKKGIFNADPSLSRNFGFLGDRAIEIDFGNFRPVTPHSREVEIERYVSRLRAWLEKEAPEWIDYLDSQLERKKSICTNI